MTKIFVFGSNLAGRHGKGAAFYAVRNHGAKYGQGVGLQGESYAIPTKDQHLRVLSIDEISIYVGDFLDFALCNPHMKFKVTAIGCGLAGYKPEQIAPLFDLPCPRNVELPDEFLKVLTR